MTGAQRMSLRRGRTDDEIAGWHSSQISFMLSQAIHKDMRASFLAHYLRGLRPEILDILSDPNIYVGPEVQVGKLVVEAITIIRGKEDAKL